MKLRVSIPQNDIDGSYINELIIDGNDDSSLKEKGFSMQNQKVSAGKICAGMKI